MKWINSLKDTSYQNSLKNKKKYVLIFIKVIKFVVKILPTKKSSDPDRFMGQIIPILYILFS